MKIQRKIEDYLDGNLTVHEREEFWLDMMENPESFEHLKTNITLRKRFRRASGRSNGKKRDAGRSYTPWIMAGAAALLISFGIILFTGPVDEPEAVDRIDQLEMDAPDLLRSETQEMDELSSQMMDAYYHAAQGEGDLAIEAYRNIITNYREAPEAATAALNAGILHYNKGNMAQARDHLVASLALNGNEEPEHEKVYWFLANAYVALGDYQGALQAAEKAYEYQGRFQERADALLEKLKAHAD